MIPIFKSKNSIEKMTLITLTDGGANSTFSDKKEMTAAGLDTINMGYNPPVVKYGKKQYTLKKKNRYYTLFSSKLLLLLPSKWSFEQ